MPSTARKIGAAPHSETTMNYQTTRCYILEYSYFKSAGLRANITTIELQRCSCIAIVAIWTTVPIVRHWGL